MVEAAGSLRFAPANGPNPISETGSTSDVDRERRDDNALQFVGTNDPDIQMVDRSEENQEHDTV